MIRIEPLDRPTPADFDTLLAVWESSVRATHDFLTEADIIGLRPQVLRAFDLVSLFIARDTAGAVSGFAGPVGDMLEMLFVRADAQGRGIGKALLFHALDRGVTRLNVNEQNPRAVGFYEHMGLEVVGRSETDDQGRPFPLLHMRLKPGRRGLPPAGYTIVPAREEHVELLNAIEAAAVGLFPPGSIPGHIRSEHVPPALLRDAMRSGTLLTALGPDGRPMGYALLRFVDGLALLAQMDVHPDHGRKGLGTALIMRIADLAHQRGADFLYLTTFTHVPWNAPFYARLGFAEIPEPELPAAIREILLAERNNDLENRTAMRLPLPPA